MCIYINHFICICFTMVRELCSCLVISSISELPVGVCIFLPAFFLCSVRNQVFSGGLDLKYNKIELPDCVSLMTMCFLDSVDVSSFTALCLFFDQQYSSLFLTEGNGPHSAPASEKQSPMAQKHSPQSQSSPAAHQSPSSMQQPLATGQPSPLVTDASPTLAQSSPMVATQPSPPAPQPSMEVLQPTPTAPHPVPVGDPCLPMAAPSQITSVPVPPPQLYLHDSRYY